MKKISFASLYFGIIFFGCFDLGKSKRQRHTIFASKKEDMEVGDNVKGNENNDCINCLDSSPYVGSLPRPKEIDYKLSDEELCQVKKYKTIDLVLVHGLPRTNHLEGAIGGFYPLEKYLEDKFSKEQLRIHKVAIPNFESKTVKGLAKELYKFLKKIKGIEKGGKHGLILIGHCAGTFTSFEAICRYSSEFNICSMISISGVWKGIKSKNFKQHKGVVGMIHKQYLHSYQKYKSFEQFDPDAKYINRVKRRLKDLDPEIKIYAIGGYTTLLDDIYHLEIPKNISGLDKDTEYSIYGSKYHDIFVDLDSQLGVGLPNIYRHTLTKPAFHVFFPNKEIINTITSFVSEIDPLQSNDLTKLFQLLNKEVPARALVETHEVCERIIRSYLLCV